MKKRKIRTVTPEEFALETHKKGERRARLNQEAVATNDYHVMRTKLLELGYKSLTSQRFVKLSEQYPALVGTFTDKEYKLINKGVFFILEKEEYIIRAKITYSVDTKTFSLPGACRIEVFEAVTGKRVYRQSFVRWAPWLTKHVCEEAEFVPIAIANRLLRSTTTIPKRTAKMKLGMSNGIGIWISPFDSDNTFPFYKTPNIPTYLYEHENHMVDTRVGYRRRKAERAAKKEKTAVAS